MTFAERKSKLLAEMQAYITECSQLDPPPVDHLADLDKCKAWAETANEAEWAKIEAWWIEVKS